MEMFYSRCLLCTRTPDVSPHLHIFSEAANQLKLSEKINKYLNIQIESELPQNVCHSCMEKLEVTHGLVTSSQQARVTLLQIKQQSGNFVHEVKQEISDCSMMHLDPYLPTTDSTANFNESCMDFGTNIS
ncbi:hypothetical protein B566_EDAN012933 [Ephemera danica]|nr:hypothetical protein B566_EDAN012933 [Ephemera danica]